MSAASLLPARQGHRRIYSWEELVTESQSFAQLRERGFSLQRMRKVITLPAERIRQPISPQTVQRQLRISPADGRHSSLSRTSPQQIVDMLKNARQPMFDICLSDEVRRVRGEIKGRGKQDGRLRRASAFEDGRAGS